MYDDIVQATLVKFETKIDEIRMKFKRVSSLSRSKLR